MPKTYKRVGANLIKKRMKKLFVIAAMAICSLGASAQVWLGGSLGLNFTQANGDAKVSGVNDETQTEFTIMPEVGYTLDEKWDVAIGLGFASVSNVGGVKDAGNETQFAVNPYARYTFANVEKLGFFVDLGVQFESISPKKGDSTSAFWGGVKPGVKYAATDKITLVAHFGDLGYFTQKDKVNKFGLNLTNGLSFGMYWSL